jgi:putative DNA primase/helicase
VKPCFRVIYVKTGINSDMSEKSHKKQSVSQLTTALRYAAEGFAVVPLHGTTAGKCTCGRDDCATPGRHPRNKNGIGAATTDRLMIEMYWTIWPKAKIGIAMGTQAGFVAIIADGVAGRTSLRKLQARHKCLPKTVTYRDGERRVRLFATGGARLCDRSHALGAGLEVVGTGDFVVAPSRIDDPEAERRFVTGRALGEIDVAPAPPWLVQLINMDAGDGSVATKSPPVEPSIIMTRVSDITPEKIEWLWPGIIASGRVTGIVGLPGIGKSQLVLDVAARVSTGRDWPGGASNGKPGQVIILSAEDNPSDTIVPRLIAAGADLDRIHIVMAVKDSDGVERTFNLAVDLDRLEKEYDLRQVRLLEIDPVSAYLGSIEGKRINRNHGGDVRAIQDRLAMFAAKHELAVVAVSHLNKSSGSRAITRIMGSLEWVAAPRAVFLVTEEANTDRRLLLPLKNNLARDRNGYGFRIEEKIVGEGIETSHLVWELELVAITAEEALAAASGVSKKLPALTDAEDFLRVLLGAGPIPAKDVRREATDACISSGLLRRAAGILGVKSRRIGGIAGRGSWVWELPEQSSSNVGKTRALPDARSIPFATK